MKYICVKNNYKEDIEDVIIKNSVIGNKKTLKNEIIVCVKT